MVSFKGAGLNKPTLAWFNREVSRSLAAMTVIFLPFQYTYLQYRGIRGIENFFEDVIWMYFTGHVIIYVLNSAKKEKVEFKSFWIRFGLLGFQLSYLLLIFAYFLFRLHMGHPSSLLQFEEDILSIIVIAMMISVMIFFISAIQNLLSIEQKKTILHFLKNIVKVYFHLGAPFYVLYLIWIYFFEIEEKGILFYLFMIYVNFVYINLIYIQYCIYRKQVRPQLFRISKWVVFSFGLVIIIVVVVRLILSFM